AFIDDKDPITDACLHPIHGQETPALRLSLWIDGLNDQDLVTLVMGVFFRGHHVGNNLGEHHFRAPGDLPPPRSARFASPVDRTPPSTASTTPMIAASAGLNHPLGLACAASLPASKNTRSPSPARAVSKATSAGPASLPFSSTGSTSRSFSPSKHSIFCVHTTRPITRPSFMRRPRGALRALSSYDPEIVHQRAPPF